MTATVTVKVAGRQVLVTERHVTAKEEGHLVTENAVILSHEGQLETFYIHDSKSLVIKETEEPSMTQEFLKTGGSARPITEEDIAKTNNAG